MRKSIGGYFEFELPIKNNCIHPNAIALNSGRCCLEYILKCRKYNKIYIPYFTCDSILDPINKLGIQYSFYSIDINYHIEDNVVLFNNEAIVYTNYWGLCDEYCIELASKYGEQLILDYTQAFYSKAIKNIDTFYSCRKFFGVPDGAYLYTNKKLDFAISKDVSYMRLDSLVKRIDLSAEEGYCDYKRISDEFHNTPIRYMSNLTGRIMQSIDYQNVANKRRENYMYLQKALGGRELSKNEVPMVFPYLVIDGTYLRRKLIENQIYVATYWPNVLKWCTNTTEHDIVQNTIPLPIDQRYNLEDMKRIIEVITQA